MKKLLVSLSLLALVFTTAVNAQNNQQKADDEGRITISPIVENTEIPSQAQKMLERKMSQLLSLNNMAGGESDFTFFQMKGDAVVLSKEMTPTAPPMTALEIDVSLTIIDKYSGKVFGEISKTVKGVGTNETKAYITAFRYVNVRSPEFKIFLEKAKEQILEYYNSHCDFVLSRAKALKKQGDNAEAIKVLKSVPAVSKDCFTKCNELLGTIEKPAEPTPVVSDVQANSDTDTDTDTSKVAKEGKDTNSASNGNSNKNVNLSTDIDYSKIGGYEGAKQTFSKITKWATFRLPIDKFGNYSYKNTVKYEGIVIRHQFTTDISNNPQFLLKILKPSIEAQGFTILLAKKNDELNARTHINGYYHNMKNSNTKFGGKYDLYWSFPNVNSTYLLAKKNIGGQTMYLSVFFVDFGKYTVISQDIFLTSE
ncbi:MAG: hypothetical protein U9R54_02975 [Bacteroidota bacterium]|nr:hypothetical protein [Bacteroidota bacterium]